MLPFILKYFFKINSGYMYSKKSMLAIIDRHYHAKGIYVCHLNVSSYIFKQYCAETPIVEP